MADDEDRNANWQINNLACDRIGLAFHINGVVLGAGTTNFDIQSLSVRLA